MTTFTDGLNGTSGDLLSARSGWSRPTGADNAEIHSSGTGVRLTSGTTAASGTWHAPTSQPSGNDQYVTAILGLVTAGLVHAGFPLGVRCDTTSATGVGYVVRRGSTGSNPNQIQLFRRSSAGGFTSLGTYTASSGDFANPVTLEVVGTNITVELLGSTVIGPVSDANIASGSVAMLSRGGALYAEASVDDWDSGDVGATAITGTASGAANTTGTATGAIQVKAAASGSVATTGSATGAIQVKASASGSASVTGSSTATVAVKGAASGSADTTGAATGSGTASTSGAATGTANVTGTATGRLTIAATASGTCDVTGSATAKVTIQGSAASTVATGGAATAVLRVMGSASGTADTAGSVTGSSIAPTFYPPSIDRTANDNRQARTVATAVTSRTAASVRFG